MKVEIRTVYFERLPGISMGITGTVLLCLRRLARIARTDKSLDVRTVLNADGELHCNLTTFTPRIERKRGGPFAMFVHWKKDGSRLRLQLAASRWNPDPPTYDSYVETARRMFQPIISAYNQKYGTRHRMRIQTRNELLPKMTPAAKEAFDRFAFRANKSSLHPADWEDFYHFINVCHRTRLTLDANEMGWLCRKAGFSVDQAQCLSTAFHHCSEFLSWLRRRV